MRATSLDSGDGLRVAAVLCPVGGSGTAEPRLLGLGEKRVFRGYYHDDVPVVVDEPHVRFLHGVYAGQDGRGLLVVLNDTDAPMTKTLRFAPTAFALSETTAKDFFTQERIDFSSGKATISLPPRESRFFRF